MTFEQLEALRKYVKSLISLMGGKIECVEDQLTEQHLFADLLLAFIDPAAKPTVQGQAPVNEKNICKECQLDITQGTCGGTKVSTGRCLAKRRGMV